MSEIAIDNMNLQKDADYQYQRYLLQQEQPKDCCTCRYNQTSVIDKPCKKCWNFNHWRLK